jgi:hypothetical protein
MSRHSFDPEIAKLVGLNAAVIYQNLLFWCEKNAANGRHIHDGKAWTYNSMKAFEELFPYLTGNQIRTALDKLETADLIESGNFNQAGYDRTKWYCVKSQMHLGKNPNGIGKKPEPIPDSKPDSKPDIGVAASGEADLFSEEEPESQAPDLIEQGFEEFWKIIWPSHSRKTAKVDCRRVYRQACEGKHPKAERITPEELNRCARAYIASVRDQQYLKAPLPWLRLPGWEPFLETTVQELTDAQDRALQYGRVPPSLQNPDGSPNATARYWLQRYGYGKAAE